MGEETITANIDVGGTFTDGFFTRGDEHVRTKVPTTEHDFTVCFMECIERGADALDVPVESLLVDADTVRFSTTLGTNTVIEKTGPQLGALVTAGHEDSLYADGDRDVTDAFVEPGLVEGIEERTTPDGTVADEPDPDAVVRAVKRLQERGARVIVIALENAFANDQNERAVKHALDEEYPRHYLGAIPTLASHEVTARPDDYRRLNTVVVNAYLHRPMKTSLYRAEDEAREGGYENPLLIGHSSGGCARVAKTIALNTYNSGPAAGAVGARALSDLYGEDLIAADMGGTSIDISLIRDGSFDLELGPDVDGIPIHIPAIDVRTVGAGGGSIASVDGDRELTVGPESAGASPGPACYGQGGQQATVTDADVVRGLVNPDYFLGGRRELHPDRAHDAVEEHVADPLDLDVPAAAAAVGRRVEAKIADSILAVADADEIDTLTAYGGAGPAHAAGFAREVGASRVVITPYSSVFSAFGESIMDVSHTYNRSLRDVDEDTIEGAIDAARAEAIRDMNAEGFVDDEISFAVDAIAHRDGDADGDTVIPLDGDIGDDLDKLRSAGDALTLRVHAEGAVPTWTFTTTDLADPDPAAAHKADRDVFWEDELRSTPIYQREDLVPGNRVDGPAVIEARDTTITVPGDTAFEVNEYGHGVLHL